MKKDGVLHGLDQTVFSVKLIFKTCFWLASVYLLFDLCIALLPFLTLYATRMIINIITEGLVNDTQLVISTIIILITGTVLSEIVSPIRELVGQTLADRLGAKTQIDLFNAVGNYKSCELFENPQFYNRLQQARSGSGQRMISVVQMLSSFLRGMATVIAAAAVFISVNWWVGIISLVGLIPNTYYGIWSSKNRVTLFRSQSESSRRLAYYDTILTGSDTAKEMRLFQIIPYIIKQYSDLFHYEQKRAVKLRTRHGFVGTACAALSAIVTASAIVLFCFWSLQEKTSVGDIVIYIGALPRFTAGLTAAINSVIYIGDNNRYVEMYTKFIKESKSRISHSLPSPSPEFNTVEFENVNFYYPGSDFKALDEVSFSVKGPGLIAIVGKNGSGKSTLAKLLLRLFDPESGTYSVDGRNAQEWDMDDFRKNQSGVMQDFCKFNFTVSDNIWFGNIHLPKQEQKMTEAAKMSTADADISKLPDGYETMLGKMFSDGKELSGGQWQKLVWARTLYSDKPFLIMDEPTSAIDPEGEYELCRSLKKVAQNKMVFYISHRLSSVIMADWIIILDNGKIAEQGKHSELMSNKGIYFSLFSKQASGYVEQ